MVQIFSSQELACQRLEFFTQVKQQCSLSIGLVGPQGVGKNTIATYLSKKMLCAQQSACDACYACQLFDAKQHPDFLRVQPNGQWIRLGDVKYLHNFLLKTAAVSSKKVVVIAEAEKLNPESGNSLLKILEEPPTNVQLYLLINNEQALLPTIYSRLLKVYFSYLSEAEIGQILQARFQFSQDHIELYQQFQFGRIEPKICANIKLFAKWHAVVAEPLANFLQRGEYEFWAIQEQIAQPHKELFLLYLLHFYQALLFYKIFAQPVGLLAKDQQKIFSQLLDQEQLYDSIDVLLESMQAILWNANIALSVEACLLKLKKIAQGEYLL